MPISLRREKRRKLRRTTLGSAVLGVLTLGGACLALTQHLMPTSVLACHVTAVEEAGTVLITSCGTFETTVPAHTIVRGHVYSLIVSGLWTHSVTHMHDLTVAEGLYYA